MHALSHPFALWVVAMLFLFAGALLSRSTDRASLTLLLVSGSIFLWTAVDWATNRHDAWTRMLAWERQHPKQRLLIGRQIGPTPENPAARVLYVHVAAILGLAQIAAGMIGAIALLS